MLLLDMQLLSANSDNFQRSTHYSLRVKLYQVPKTNLNVTFPSYLKSIRHVRYIVFEFKKDTSPQQNQILSTLYIRYLEKHKHCALNEKRRES